MKAASRSFFIITSSIFRSMTRIEINPAICNGKPVITGTRISVQTILSYLGAGDSMEDILQAHPRLVRDDILACLAHARRPSRA